MNEVDNVLGSVQAKYRDLAKRDVLNCLSQFRDLFPKPENYVFSDGISRLLFTLSGTIPVNYKGSTYNIPICIYLLDTHPYHPPLVYVRPTADMRVAPSKYVDQAGRVYMPYLTEWKHPKSDLYELVNILAMIFGENCPVFAKRASGSQPQMTTSQSFGGGAGMPMPQMPQPGGFGGSTSNFGGSSFPAQSTPYPMYPAYNSQQSSNSVPGSGQPRYPTSLSQSSSQTSSYTSQLSAGSTVTNEHIRASMVSAVEDKIRRKLRESVGEKAAELQALKTTRDDLLRGKTRVDELHKKLQTEQERIEKAIMMYQDASDRMDKVLKSSKRSDEMQIDDCVDTTAPLYRQLVKAFAADNAMDDAVYYLGEALKLSVIELDVYLKHVRRLSRQQFMLRATMTKCREKAGLGAV